MQTFPRVYGFLVIIAAIFLFNAAESRLLAREKALSSTQIGYTPLKAPNACLPDSMGFQSAYQVYQQRRRADAWSRVLIVYLKEGTNVHAHAYCVFTVAGKVWTYDQVGGSQRVWVAPEEKSDATKLGRQLAARSFLRATWADLIL